MKRTIEFTKAEGCGNDFIIVDARDFTRAVTDALFKRLRAQASRLSDRRRGVGFDQILFLSRATRGNGDLRMSIIDADGSIAEMCGNGVRAVHLFSGKARLGVETLAGRIETVSVGARSRGLVRVNMGMPRLIDDSDSFRVRAAGRSFEGMRVSMGNPHYVVFAPIQAREVEKYGRAIEHHRLFKGGVNTEWVKRLSKDAIQVDVWERGSGQTLACGTGACASAVAAIELGQVRSSDVQVHMPGGALQISWKGRNEPVFMTGPAKIVFEGVLSL